MRTIAAEGMYFYAYHGYYEEERRIGNRFRVDVYVKTTYEEEKDSDALAHTIDYGAIYQLVRKEMQQPSKLLEDVAQRIIETFKATFKGRIEQNEIFHLKVRVTKHRPPVEGYMENATITLEENLKS